MLSYPQMKDNEPATFRTYSEISGGCLLTAEYGISLYVSEPQDISEVGA